MSGLYYYQIIAGYYGQLTPLMEQYIDPNTQMSKLDLKFELLLCNCNMNEL